MKRNLLTHVYSLILITCYLCHPLKAESINTFSKSDKDLTLAEEIIEILEEEHFIKLKFKDIQNEATQEYINNIDPNHTIFLDHEVLDFIVGNILNIDESLEQAFEIFNLYSQRYKFRYNLQIDFLEVINLNDLFQEKEIILDRSEQDWETDLVELKKLWKDFMVNDLISLMLNGNSLKDSKEKITKRLNSQLNYFNKTKNEDVFDIYINSLTSRFGPATSYFSPKRAEDFDIDMKLSLEGIGAILSSDGLYTTIVSIVPGGPADKSNLLSPNDKIISVGQEDSSMEDIIGWRIVDTVRLIRGPKESNVTLEIIPANALNESETKVISIKRDIVKLEDQSAKKEIVSIRREDKELLIGVIKLPAFYMDFDAYQRREYDFKSSSKDVKELIKELESEGINGLILDLRNNGGGSLYEASALAHLFLGAGQTVQVKGPSGEIQSLGKRRGFQFYDKPLGILVNKFSASASEILAGAIQDYKRGLVIGTETFGKGTVQRMTPLSLGELKFTESKFYRVSGDSVQLKGVVPDILIPDIIDVDEFGMKTLDKALKGDRVPPVKHKSFNRNLILKEELEKNMIKRITSSPVFQYMSEEKEWRVGLKQKQKFSLNLNTRKQEKKNAEQSFLNRNNKYRGELGGETFNSYKEYLDSIKGDSDKKEEILDSEKEILKEASNILVDYIESSFLPVVAKLNYKN